MSKVLCIYPAESNTEFLRPVFDYLCTKNDVCGIDRSVTEDDYFDVLEEQLTEAELVLFMGHGSSKVLFGENNNELFSKYNIDLLKNKKLILFACRTSDFSKTYNLKNAVGFGFIPSSEEDVHNGTLHHLDIEKLDFFDVKSLRASLCNILLNTVKESNLLNLDEFVSCFAFNTNVEIVRYLTTKKETSKNYRLLADILYYIRHEMILKR